MASPWLKDYFLDQLASKISKIHSQHPSPAADDSATNTASAEPRRIHHSRLVKILARGQGERLACGDWSGNGWWNVRQRGSTPNLANHTNAWLLISDGSHSARVYLTIGALKQIFDWDNKNNNDDSLFGRGCCVLLKQYYMESASLGNNNEGDGDNLEERNDSLLFKVSSLEPKPGFNHHANSNDSFNSSASISPVMKEIDLLYGLQFLARERQLDKTHTSSTCGETNGSPNGTTNPKSVVRDWDVAFGRLSKGILSTSTLPGGAAVTDENSILNLAEKASSTEEAIREWENKKKEYGITGADDNFNIGRNSSDHQNDRAQTKTNADSQEETHTKDSEASDEDEDEEDDSRLFIQNVLATQEEEETGEGGGGESNMPLSTQTENDDNEEENQSSTSEELLLPETQPTAAALEKRNELNGQPNSEKELEEGLDATRINAKRKRNRTSDDQSVSVSSRRLAMYDSIGTTRHGPRSPRRRRGNRQNQNQSRKRSKGIWDSVKTQLFDPDRAIVYCVPSFQLTQGSHGSGDDHTYSTPMKRSARGPGDHLVSGSDRSGKTNLTDRSTPNPSSGAYYRKYGLSRWLSRNTIAVESDSDSHNKSNSAASSGDERDYAWK